MRRNSGIEMESTKKNRIKMRTQMLLKSCRCGKLIPQSMKMCEECEQRQQSRHMIYNNTRRDERAAEFYVSKEWRAMRERIIEVYDNVDIYALYVEHELLTCNPVHHIIELEDDWEQRLNPFNLILALLCLYKAVIVLCVLWLRGMRLNGFKRCSQSSSSSMIW